MMPEVQGNSVDVIVTSPPYASLVGSYSHKEGEAGSEFDLSRYNSFGTFFTEISKTWAECERVLRPGGVLVCNWSDYPPGSRYSGYPREICLCGPMVESIEKSGLILISRWFVRRWGTGAAGMKCPYTLYDNLKSTYPRAMANVDYVFAFYKREYKPTSRKVDFSRKEWIEWTDGVWNMNFTGEGLDISGGATYPVEFAKRCMRIYSSPGDVVLDPFLGSGSTMKAAFQSGRSCIGFEVLERMLSTIKSKVGYGSQGIGEELSWKIVNRYKGGEK